MDAKLHRFAAKNPPHRRQRLANAIARGLPRAKRSGLFGGGSTANLPAPTDSTDSTGMRHYARGFAERFNAQAVS